MQTETENVEMVVVDAVVAHQHLAGPLLPILHQIQSELRHIPGSALNYIAKALNLSRAEVHGVVSYYHSFTTKPHGKTVIEVCRAESCQAVGGRKIEQRFKDALGLDFGETSSDGNVTLESVYCLGNCACSPSVRVGENIYGRITESGVNAIVDKAISQLAKSKELNQ